MYVESFKTFSNQSSEVTNYWSSIFVDGFGSECVVLQYFSCPMAAVCLLCLSHLAFVWHVTSGGGWLGAVIDGNLLHYQLIIKPGQMSRCCPVATSVPPRCPAELQNLSKHFLKLLETTHNLGSSLIFLTTCSRGGSVSLKVQRVKA